MALYNITFLDTATNVYTLFQGVDAIKPGWFSAFILFTMFLISLVMFKDNMKNGFLISSFGLFFVGILMFTNSMIGIMHMGVIIAIFVGALIYKIWGE